MADTEKLNIDSIIARLLEGLLTCLVTLSLPLRAAKRSLKWEVLCTAVYQT